MLFKWDLWSSTHPNQVCILQMSLKYVACCPLGVCLKPFMYILKMKQSLFCFERVLSVNSERLIMQMADRLAEDGYRDAGYKYVSIDVSCF